MRGRTLGFWLLVLAVSGGVLQAQMVTRRLRLPPDAPPTGAIRFDLSSLPRGARIYRADLRIFRTAQITGRDDEALVDIEIQPVLETPGRALALGGPWFDRFDATEAVRAWASGRANGGFLVKACPRWNRGATCLDVACDGKPQGAPPAVKGLKVHHRAGQTFIVFEEIDDRSADASPTWADLKARLDRLDAEREVRYRVYRHTAPITAASLPEAELLGEVKPMSGYNVPGRSVDRLIALHRRRAMDDLEFSKQLARGDYFSKYSPDMPEMGELPIQRLAVEDGKPLPPRMGLYVHQPAKAGTAWYTVVSVVDGVANTGDLPEAKPVEETVGPGELVFQGQADVTVFFDYPGERRHYVQWAAPPLANLPDQYCNWGVFVPAGYEKAEGRRLGVFFHDYTQRYLKPPWPHRRDTVLLAPHDAPYRSFGYGYHESLGTLRSFRQGQVQPFFGRRVDAMIDWALREFGADAGRVSCGGSGYWGGTAALQFALRRPGRIAYVMVEDTPDPDPRQTPYEYAHYSRDDPRKTRRPDLDAVWGKADWKIPAESGKPIWDEMNLVSCVLANGTRQTLPYLVLGAGSMHLTWKQESDLMKAYLQTHNAFMAEFFWGSSRHLDLPVDTAKGESPFEPRADRPLLACNPQDRGPEPAFFEKHFATGERGYSSGGRLNTRPRWHPEDIVDAPDRLEMTIYTAKQVVYAGRVVCDVVLRNTHSFRPKPGEKLLWAVTESGKKERQSGETAADASGLIPIPGLQFAEPARLVVRRAAEGGGP
jgi:hypothetical protein